MVLKYNQVISGSELTNDRLDFIQSRFDVALGHKLMEHIRRVGGEHTVSISEFKVSSRPGNTYDLTQEVIVIPME